MDTWEHAYNTINTIEAINPNIKVVGPSFSGFYWNPTPKSGKLHKTNGIKGFLDEAQSRGVLPDFVSWHYPFAGLYDQVGTVNNFSNENYMDFDGIRIGEYLTPVSRQNGNAAYAIAQMERASIDSVNDVALKAATLDPEQAQSGVLDGVTLINLPVAIHEDLGGFIRRMQI